MKPFIFTALFFALATSLQARTGHALEQQIVSVRVTSQQWNEYRPWQKKSPRTDTYVGTVLADNKILMLTDNLADATLIQVEKFDRPPRHPARIVHFDPQIGLGIITVDEPGFFDDLTPVTLAKRMEGQEFYCATWMSGQLSFAACRWSQATVYDSGIPYISYLGIDFITDLNGGGWGEPVFSGETMVGISNSQQKNTATVLPAELIQAYLKAAAQPDYPGFGWLGIRYQSNKGPAQSAYAGQTGTPSGVRIRTCFPGSSADGILLPNDLLLELDGYPIDALGDYNHPIYGPLDLNLIVTDRHQAGDTIKAKLLRDREKIEVDLPLRRIMPSEALIPKARIGTPPPYLVAGGLVFRELDVPYLKAWGKKWNENIPAYLRTLFNLKSEAQSPQQQRLIILADVFPDEYNLGYHDMAQNIVKAVNGRPIDSIEKMEDAFQHPENGFHIIEFMPSFGMSKVILDAEHFEQATQDIMEKYQIPNRIRINPET